MFGVLPGSSLPQFITSSFPKASEHLIAYITPHTPSFLILLYPAPSTLRPKTIPKNSPSNLSGLDVKWSGFGEIRMRTCFAGSCWAFGYIWQVLLPSVPQKGPPLLQRSMTLTLDLGFCVRAPRPLGVYVKTDTGEASDATARTNLLNSDSAFDIAPILQVNE